MVSKNLIDLSVDAGRWRLVMDGLVEHSKVVAVIPAQRDLFDRPPAGPSS